MQACSAMMTTLLRSLIVAHQVARMDRSECLKPCAMPDSPSRGQPTAELPGAHISITATLTFNSSIRRSKRAKEKKLNSKQQSTVVRITAQQNARRQRAELRNESRRRKFLE